MSTILESSRHPQRPRGRPKKVAGPSVRIETPIPIPTSINVRPKHVVELPKPSRVPDASGRVRRANSKILEQHKVQSVQVHSTQSIGDINSGRPARSEVVPARTSGLSGSANKASITASLSHEDGHLMFSISGIPSDRLGNIGRSRPGKRSAIVSTKSEAAKVDIAPPPSALVPSKKEEPSRMTTTISQVETTSKNVKRGPSRGRTGREWTQKQRDAFEARQSARQKAPVEVDNSSNIPPEAELHRDRVAQISSNALVEKRRKRSLAVISTGADEVQEPDFQPEDLLAASQLFLENMKHVQASGLFKISSLPDQLADQSISANSHDRIQRIDGGPALSSTSNLEIFTHSQSDSRSTPIETVDPALSPSRATSDPEQSSTKQTTGGDFSIPQVEADPVRRQSRSRTKRHHDETEQLHTPARSIARSVLSTPPMSPIIESQTVQGGESTVSGACPLYPKQLAELDLSDFSEHVEQCVDVDEPDTRKLTGPLAKLTDSPFTAASVLDELTASISEDLRDFSDSEQPLPPSYTPYGGSEDDLDGMRDPEELRHRSTLGNLTRPDEFLYLLEDPSSRSTAALYTITSHVASVLRTWQDEWMAIETRVASRSSRAPQNPRAPIDPISWEDQKEAALYGFRWDPAPEKRGMQNYERQSAGLVVGGKELRKRKPTARALGLDPEDVSGGEGGPRRRQPTRRGRPQVTSEAAASGAAPRKAEQKVEYDAESGETPDASDVPSRPKRGRPELSRILHLRDEEALPGLDSGASTESDATPAPTPRDPKRKGRPPKHLPSVAAANPMAADGPRKRKAHTSDIYDSNKSFGADDQVGASKKERIKSARRSAAMQRWWNERRGINGSSSSKNVTPPLSPSTSAVSNVPMTIQGSNSFDEHASNTQSLPGKRRGRPPGTKQKCPPGPLGLKSARLVSSGADESDGSAFPTPTAQDGLLVGIKSTPRLFRRKSGKIQDDDNDDDGLTEFERFQRLSRGEVISPARRDTTTPSSSQPSKTRSATRKTDRRHPRSPTDQHALTEFERFQMLSRGQGTPGKRRRISTIPINGFKTDAPIKNGGKSKHLPIGPRAAIARDRFHRTCGDVESGRDDIEGKSDEDHEGERA